MTEAQPDFEAEFEAIVAGIEAEDTTDEPAGLIRAGNGEVILDLPENLREILAVSMSLLLAILEDTESRGYARLVPVVHEDDLEAEAGMALGRLELLDAHKRGAELVLASITSRSLTVDEANTWLKAVGAARAALYAQAEADANDETAQAFAQSDQPEALVASVDGYVAQLLCEVLDELDPIQPRSGNGALDA